MAAAVYAMRIRAGQLLCASCPIAAALYSGIGTSWESRVAGCCWHPQQAQAPSPCCWLTYRVMYLCWWWRKAAVALDQGSKI